MSAPLVEERPVITIEIDGASSLTDALIDQIVSAADRLEDIGSSAIAVCHVQGSRDPAVCSWPGSAADVTTVTRWERALSRLETARAMTMTVVEGTCSAVALELLLVSDRRLASADFSMPRLGRGGDLWPGMSLYRLSRQIGESRARRFFLDPADVSAARCLTLDIVDDIVEGSGQSALVTGLMRFAPVQDLPIWRRLLQESTSTDFHEALAAHLVACDRVLRRATPRTSCDAPHDVVVGQ